MNWSLLQSGIGIDIHEDDFRAVCVKRQLQRIRVAGRLEIPGYRRLGPGECGRLYREFLQKNGLKVPWTVVALPRSAVLVRWLSFPAAIEKELARAIEYQLDSLHPFEGGGVYWDFAPWKSSPGALAENGAAGGPERIHAAVVIAEKKFVEETAAWFQEAGIGVSQFTVTTLALLAAFQPRLHLSADRQAASRAMFFLNVGQEALEIAGFAPGVSLVSKELPGAPQQGQEIVPRLQRELGLLRSELRLDPEERPPLVLCGRRLAWDVPAASEELQATLLPAEHLFPSLGSKPESFLTGEQITAFAAALAAADRTLPFSLNLLPAEKRSYRSALAYLSVYVLSGIILILALASGMRGAFQDWRYHHYLEQQIEALQPQLQTVESAESQSRRAYERLALLNQIKDASALPLGILNNLTGTLPPDAWIQQFQYDGETLSMTGYAKSASQLLQTLAGSGYFESPQFLSAVTRTPDGNEAFRIGVRLRKP